MATTARFKTERIFHDRQARQRAATFATEPGRLRFSDDDYLDHEPWVRPAMDRLGDVRDRRVLDFGCGHGMAAVVLARRGARVTACDLSTGYVAEAECRARANGVSIQCVATDGERLPFCSRAFDAVWGHAILHHLNVASAARELNRILKPDGIAIFCEPWGGNPILRLARQWMPAWPKSRTPLEEPLLPRHIQKLCRVFHVVRMQPFQVLSIAVRVIGRPAMVLRLERADSMALQRYPGLARWCRYVVIELRPKA